MPRFISMKDFRDKESNVEAQRLYNEAEKNGTAVKAVPLGQILGHVSECAVKTGTLPNGDTKDSCVAYGKFRAVIYKTGEVIESTTAYLPGYFAEDLMRTLNSKSNNGADILFGVEIVMKGTGKSIPVTYEVIDQVGLSRSKPLDALAKAMAAKGVLRMPPPPEFEALAAPEPEAPIIKADAPDNDGEPDPETMQEVATKITGKAKRAT